MSDSFFVRSLRGHPLVPAVLVSLALVACGGGGGETSAPTPLPPVPVPAAAPVITSNPAAAAVLAGQSASFSVAASGDGPLAYQWRRAETDVPGANSTTYTLANAQVADSGSAWSVRVSNGGGAVLSAPAVLTVQPAGTLSLVAGAIAVDDPASSGFENGPAASARFRDIGGLAPDGAGNLFVADTSNHAIRKISAAGDVTTLGWTGVPAAPGLRDGLFPTFQYPAGLGFDASGNLYVTEGWLTIPFNVLFYWTRVRKITPAGFASTVFSQAFPQSPQILGPTIAVDGAGAYALSGAGGIFRVNPSGIQQEVAPAPAPRVISSLAVDRAGVVYFGYANTIRKIVPGQPEVVLAGTGARGHADGAGSQATFDFEPYAPTTYGPMLKTSIAVDSVGNVYVADDRNFLVRKVAPDGSVTTVAGTPGERAIRPGPLPAALVPRGLALAGDKTLYVSTPTAVLRIDLR